MNMRFSFCATKQYRALCAGPQRCRSDGDGGGALELGAADIEETEDQLTKPSMPVLASLPKDRRPP